MLTKRQEKLLNFLIKEYITTAEPVGSLSLKKASDLDISGATIRNDLQELTKQGFIEQPHTSAGRVPTKKAYRYITEKLEEQKQAEFDDFIVRQIKFAHQEMERQMETMQELMQTLENDNLFEILTTIEIWHKKNQN
ncbi:MAG: DeoR family transcriptional regulator [Candidatus Staskawiczbacteria bacterium]|nr:DeoR family transcriptional regulator [Candidatus Staskawiczbacteria bacterium]